LSTEIVRIQDLHKTYRMGALGIAAIRGISMNIRRGEMVALMGASGSGKTTLMNILGCMDRPSAGRYLFDGHDTSKLSSDQRARIRNRNIGFVFQSFNLLPRTSALENVAMPLFYSAGHLPPRDAYERAGQALQRVGLGDRLEHESTQLSGGQQQRVAIARALVNRPKMLLADEPTGNLDSRTGVEILEMFRHLNRAERITMLLITHDFNVAAYADRVILIRDGRVVDPCCRPRDIPAMHAVLNNG
jgi:ABC-type lipoprotein export system ATPase subunit